MADAKEPTQLVAIGELGRRIGESHQNAKLSNADVDLIFTLREEGLSLSVIAKKFGVGKAAIFKITSGLRRSQTPERWMAPRKRAAPRIRPEPRRKPKEPEPPPINTAAVALQNALNSWR